MGILTMTTALSLFASACTDGGDDSTPDSDSTTTADSGTTGDSGTTDTGTSPHGDPVEFNTVAYGYDDVGAWKDPYPVGDCDEPVMHLVHDQPSLDKLFANHLAENTAPKIDFSGKTMAVLSYTVLCSYQPTHVQVDRVFRSDRALYLKHTVHQPGKAYEEVSRPYTVITLDDVGYAEANGEAEVETVPFDEWKWGW